MSCAEEVCWKRRRSSWCRLKYKVSRPVEAPQNELQFSSLTSLKGGLVWRQLMERIG